MRPTSLLLQAVAAGTLLLCSGVARAETITLSDAIERALKFAPSAALASAAMDFSEAEARERSASLSPSISAQGEYEQMPGFDSRITNRGQTDALLMLDYTAYDFGRRVAQVRAARYAAEAAQLGAGAVRAQIVYDVKVAYFDLLRNLHLERELESSLDRMTRYVATTRALVRTGKAIANDALKVEVASDDVELALVAARRTRERASVTLGSMLGEWGKTDLKAAEVESIATAPVATAPGGDLA
ncbi:MAG: TolC family protein, partial [Candidatus Binataceae bacterium]